MASGPSNTPHPNPYLDVPSWWEYFLSGQYDWQWASPHLYFKSKLQYTPRPARLAVVDALGRKKFYSKPFECYIDPFSGKFKELCVQAPRSICQLATSDNPNATWNRTPIRNAVPFWQRLADLPYRGIPVERRGDSAKFTAKDMFSLALMWLVAVVAFFLSVCDNTLPLQSELDF